jgi:Peptidyl-prolyl cis-trans isomerase (rotamase) - cyclophilin family
MRLKKLLTAAVSTVCAAVLVLSMVSCGNKKSSSSKAEASSVEVDESKSFTVALYPEYAPSTCENFENLVKSGFYDGLTFHRVVKGFMAQGGGFDKNNQYKESPNIKGEFAANGFTQNTLSHTRGVVSMARATDMNSASSQFFICYNDKNIAALDGRYAGFGKVTKGMEVVDDFLKVERAMAGEQVPTYPVTPIVIVKAEMIEDDSEGHHQVKFYMDF